MTIHHNRQARRASRCVEARSPRGSEPSHPHQLAQVAARIAGELELSSETIHDLLFTPAEAPPREPTSYRE
jgi:hypothetical protein